MFTSKVLTGLAALLALGSYIPGTLATALQIPEPILKDFDNTGVLGALYRPNATTPRSRVAVYVMHAEQDYTSFIGCTELQKRGFTVFCANIAASKYGYMSDISFEEMMTEVNTGLFWLRNLTEIDKVVILGHSGGGNGVAACNGPEKIYPCSDAMAGLEPGDGLMLLDANYGISTMALLSLNPAVEDEANLSKMNQSLNVYNPANGFSNGTQSNFTADFKQRYQKGAVSRNNRVLDYAQKRLAAIEAGNGTYGDDEPLTIPASLYVGFNNLYITQDSTIINSIRTPSNFDDISSSWESAALKTSVRRYLSTLAVRASDNFSINTDGFQGIEYDSTQMAPFSSIKGVSVPLLTMGMTGHYEYLNAEKTHLQAGAQHTINVCTDCESYPGEFGDTVATCFDYVGEWLGKTGRFIGARAMSE
ncbi:hypothetical protein BDW62DRAFT_209560 [Aspergillus aurantiobrunneus]